MEETRRSLFSLATVCCLLAGALLPLPGGGQTQSSEPPSTVVSHVRVSLSEAGNRSYQTTASAVNGMNGSSTVTSQLNASGSGSPELPAPTTVGFLSITAGPQTTISRNVDNLTASSVEGNQSSYADAVTTTSWNSSSNFMPTDPFQSKETQDKTGTTATPWPKSSTFSTLVTTKRILETMPATDHEAITEHSTDESTSPPSFTDIDGSVLTLAAATSEAASSTFRPHGTTPMEMKRLTDHVQEKTSGLHMEDYDENLPSIPTDGPIGGDPLVIAVIFIFTVTVGILALMGFLRYRQRNNRLQFRRLQDLPMDDMMEDTPLSLYSY
ncbi:PREDICTED: protein EGT2-like [Gekko japonicus]|uniref:Protein EGT2-like n=1 Tax=Gekko japonicus TaxID=146911 RepID=A0ABM1JQN4_GEKJA|nr:PREDICTED: protein EGT2-like [Gekko japonicus]